jgi:hypothetical protein
MKVFILITSFMILSCGFKEDPISDWKSLDTARPSDDFSEKPKRVEGMVMIDAVERKTFIENKTDRIQINVRALSPEFEKNKEVIIENILSFPGAKFDRLTGVFEWTPPLGTTRGDYLKDFSLNVRANVKSDRGRDARWDTTDLQIPISVIKDPQEPVIQSVGFSKGTSIREGDDGTFDIEVYDPEGSLVSPPDLNIMAPDDDGDPLSLAPFIYFVSHTVDIAAKKWTFTYRWRLGKAELTASSSDAGFRVIAKNKFGKVSKVYEAETVLYTRLEKPVSNWSSDREIIYGQDNVVQFRVHSPKLEAYLSYTIGEMPNGASMECSEMGAPEFDCTFRWKPTGDPRDFPKEGEVTVEVTSANRDTDDTLVLDTTIHLPFKGIVNMPGVR